MVPMLSGFAWFIIILILLVALAVGWALSAHNGLVRLRNQVQESWNQVDVELQRRHDLLPNLVATVKGIAGHERNTLEEVIRLRNQAASMNRPGALPTSERAAVEEQLTTAVHQMMVTVESYPELRSSQNFLELQRALTETEDRIAAGRRFFNANVRAYNTKVESVPTNFIASMGKFEKANYFEVRDAETRQAQTIDFDSLSAVGPTQSQREAQAEGRGAIPAPTYQSAYPAPGSNQQAAIPPFQPQQQAYQMDTPQQSAATQEAYAAAPAQATNPYQPQSGYPQGASPYAEPVSGNLPQVDDGDAPGYAIPTEPTLQPTRPANPMNPTIDKQY